MINHSAADGRAADPAAGDCGRWASDCSPAKTGGKRRRLGVAAVADRVQASMKLVLEPIFEVDCVIKGRSAVRLLFAPVDTR